MNSNKVDLRYGRGSLTISLPDDSEPTIIRKPRMPILSSPVSAIDSALAQPIASEPLAGLARSADSACIAICDITRPVPNRLFLRPLIEQLCSSGISLDQIVILVATGLHRPNLGSELEELIGDPWVLANVRVENHQARDDESHVLLGTTKTRQTVVRLDRRFVEADLKIATGLVEPHFMAGYSGGRKVVSPGLAHAETITTFHSARFMADPAARNCNFENNPLHEEQLEIIRMLGPVYGLNTVIDEDRQLSFVNFGEIVQSHRAAVEFASQYCETSVPHDFDIVVTSAAGHPLDQTYYQTIKGMVGAMEILRPGGNLIIAAQCSEGLGSKEFIESQQRLIALGPEAFLRSILEKSHADIDEWQTQMQLKPQNVGTLYLYSDGLTDAQHALTGVLKASSVESAITASLRDNLDRRIAIIPEGPYIVPRVSTCA